MKTGTKLSIVLIASTAVLLTATSIFYSQSNAPSGEENNTFKQLKNKISISKFTGTLLAEGDGVGVTYERFLFYKRNAELLNSLQDKNSLQHTLSNEEILNELIAADLSIKFAKDIGLTVTDEEIDEAIKMERSALEGDDSDNSLVRELMTQRIKMTGLTEDEFWDNTETRYNYEKAILLGKLATKLIEEGTIESISDISKFQLELLNEHKAKIKINDALVAENT